MTGTNKPDALGFTYDAYLFIRTAVRRGRVYGYWKNGGQFRPGDSDSEPFAFIDMLPRGGWDGRIRFVKKGDPAPGTEHQTPQRPGSEGDDEADDDEQDHSRD
jgi:hypothetical protein